MVIKSIENVDRVSHEDAKRTFFRDLRTAEEENILQENMKRSVSKISEEVVQEFENEVHRDALSLMM